MTDESPSRREPDEAVAAPPARHWARTVLGWILGIAVFMGAVSAANKVKAPPGSPEWIGAMIAQVLFFILGVWICYKSLPPAKAKPGRPRRFDRFSAHPPAADRESAEFEPDEATKIRNIPASAAALAVTGAILSMGLVVYLVLPPERAPEVAAVDQPPEDPPMVEPPGAQKLKELARGMKDAVVKKDDPTVKVELRPKQELVIRKNEPPEKGIVRPDFEKPNPPTLPGKIEAKLGGPGASVFLSDLPEFGWIAGPSGWSFGKDGKLGNSHVRNGKILIGKATPAKGLSMHPPHTGYTRICYLLKEQARTLRGQAAIGEDESATRTPPTRFLVLGDGEVLWRSDSIAKPGVKQAFELDVGKVNVLELRVYVEAGPCTGAHAVWIDPLVVLKD